MVKYERELAIIMPPLNLNDALVAYRQGIFPMAESKTSNEIFWIKPEERGIIPIGKLHISRSLKKYIKSKNIKITINMSFDEVVQLCADRPTSWINNELLKMYRNLKNEGSAVSIEAWDGKDLIGGLFGVIVGSCFCAESMFSSAINGSKLALVATMGLLKFNGFQLFDTQFPNKHLESMGGITIPQSKYEKFLISCINENCGITDFPNDYSWSEIMQLNNDKL